MYVCMYVCMYVYGISNGTLVIAVNPEVNIFRAATILLFYILQKLP
jgi:hypothetical protein